MSEVFLDYAKYYDLLYKEKDYKSEAEFIISLIKKHAPHAKTILNLGCGTGKHDSYLAKAGYQVTGLDFSEEMIKIAKSNKTENCEFIVGDARSFKFDKKFDVIISLFHVFSYQTSNADAVGFLQTIRNLLTDNGISIFDYWYGPAVLFIRPESRVKTFESNEMKVTRHANTDMNFVNNVATVNYKIEIENKLAGNKTNLSEAHPMRYFFTPELDLLFEKSKLQLIDHKAWLKTDVLPSEDSWAAYSVVKGF